jgi:NADH:ubiquinone oxidoreductase subunit K
VSLFHYLTLSAVVFCIGLYGVLTRRDMLGFLMSIELMFNAAAINFVAFNHFLYPDRLWGQGAVIFIISVAAAEAVVGLSLIVAIYRDVRSIYSQRINPFHG